MLESISNLFFFRNFRARRFRNKLVNCFQSEFAEEFLQLLLNLMSLMFYLDRDFRRNIKGFNARYLFKSRDSGITVAAVFRNGKMKVLEKEINGTNVTVIFKDHKALKNFLLSPKPDILQAILNQDVTYTGNLNYLSKFAYMAKHLQLMTTRGL